MLSDFLIGRKCIVFEVPPKYEHLYDELKEVVGTIVEIHNGKNIGLHIPGVFNERSERGIFWLNNETTKSSPDYIAEALYNAGYRKASDVASEIIDAVFEILDAEYRQYDTETLSDVLNKMYMSSRNTVIKITAELVKFKEKYTEEWE